MIQDAEQAQNIAKNIAELLSEKKAEDIAIMDVSKSDYMSKFVVIATAMAGKHALSLLHYIKEDLKQKGMKYYAIDEESEDWIIIDLGVVIVHIFTENHRKKYNLEEFLQKCFIQEKDSK